MQREPILAKSPSGGHQVTLATHTRAVVECAGHLFGTGERPTRLGRAWLRFFQIDHTAFPLFRQHVDVACLLHDLGKANNGFQDAVRKRGQQVVRHEHLSALLLDAPPLCDYLQARDTVDWAIIQAAVADHHLKASPDSLGRRLTEGARTIALFLDAPEAEECLAMCGTVLGVGVPAVAASVWDKSTLADRVRQFRDTAHAVGSALEDNEPRRRFLAAVKAALIVADAAGSAITRGDMSMRGWLRGCFPETRLSGSVVEQSIVTPRIHEIEQRDARPFTWHEFQEAAGRLGARALLLAPCAAGKTLAAWRWIQAQLDRHDASRVIFLYPTRATATEGFRDYVSWAGDGIAALQHGTASYDLDRMFTNPDDPRIGRDYAVEERLFALGYWPKQVFSATVDSFLAFLRSQYAALCMLPVLCDSVVVVDEVHAFDRSMFTALERFLKFFDLPVLCMTATLTDDRRRILREECQLDVFPGNATRFADLDAVANMGRYDMRVCEDATARRSRNQNDERRLPVR